MRITKFNKSVKVLILMSLFYYYSITMLLAWVLKNGHLEMSLMSIVSNLLIIYWTPHPVKVIQIVTHKKRSNPEMCWYSISASTCCEFDVCLANKHCFHVTERLLSRKQTNKQTRWKIPLALVSRAERLSEPTGGSTRIPDELAVLSQYQIHQLVSESLLRHRIVVRK